MTAWPRRPIRCFKCREETFQAERHLRHQAEVDLVVHQDRIGGDETGVAAHQLHQADAVAGADGLAVGAVGGPFGLGHGGFETESGLNERDVVVDRFGDADDGELQTASGDLLMDGLGPAQGPVAADGKQKAHLHPLQRVHHVGRVLRTPGRAQNRPPQFVDIVDRRRGQFQRDMPEAAAESFVPVPETIDGLHPVMIIEAQHDGPDHVVQTRAKSPAGDDAGLEPGRVKKDSFPWTGRLP